VFGGAVGDALGAPIEFDDLQRIRKRFGENGVSELQEAYGVVGAGTDDTQMTLFTAEGLIRAHVRGVERGVSDAAGVIGHAYARWLATQGEQPRVWSSPPDGWLAGAPEMHHRRAPGNTCLRALEADRIGTIEEPLNDSKGCGAVMRSAPIGLSLALPRGRVFDVACEAGALTHGHPTGYLAAGAFAELIAGIARDGMTIDLALDQAEWRLFDWPAGGAAETIKAIEGARELARPGNGIGATPEAVESLGGGWVAEQALAIGVYCALVARDFSHGVLLAANHSGDSDSTASICGNILGALHGIESVPPGWVAQLELNKPVTRICDDWEYLDAHEGLVVQEDWIDEEWASSFPPN
jgi:ADP-ribosyl-[dinitrogen reductase] hydrolase